MVEFLVVDTQSAYNVILGRPSLYKFKAMISVYHHMMKFPYKNEVGIMRGEQKATRSCYKVSFCYKRVREGDIMVVEALKLQASGKAPKDPQGAQAAK